MPQITEITMSGYSDDIICTSQGTRRDEIEFDAERPRLLRLVAPNGEVMGVLVNYIGVWSFAPCMLTEGQYFPDWPIQITAKHEYSMQIAVTAPHGTRILDDVEQDD